MTQGPPTPAGVPTSDVSPAAWALRYAAYGWSVVPVHSEVGGRCTCGERQCPAAAKHPRVKWEPAMSEPASAEQLIAWWTAWPEANVGVVTGTVSGVVVIDVDPRHGGEAELRNLEGEFGLLPLTPEVRTGGGGRHLWFRCPAPLPTKELRPGVDLKADGGMVVAPPSRHISGKRYVWRPGGGPEEVAMNEVPSWIAALAIYRERQPHPERESPQRTALEQTDFSAAWLRVGIELRPGDQYYLCPFHDDHRPSLHIDAEGCRWYCFGCGIGGGVGRLLQMLGNHEPVRPRARLRQLEGRGQPVTLHGKHEVDVVGESYHQDELLELTGGRRRYGGVDVEAVAELRPDADNPHDPQAVVVEIHGRPVGHVRREDLEWVRPLIDESLDLHGLATCRAIIRGGWDRGPGAIGLFGVRLELPAPGDPIV